MVYSLKTPNKPFLDATKTRKGPALFRGLACLNLWNLAVPEPGPEPEQHSLLGLEHVPGGIIGLQRRPKNHQQKQWEKPKNVGSPLIGCPPLNCSEQHCTKGYQLTNISGMRPENCEKKQNQVDQKNRQPVGPSPGNSIPNAFTSRRRLFPRKPVW